MSSNIYSRATFLAHQSLQEIETKVNKGQIREVIAALHGFGSLAAMQAALPLGLDRTPKSVMVHVDRGNAVKRIAELVAPADPSKVVSEVVLALNKTSTDEHFYIDSIGDIRPNLEAFARKVALSAPEMAGVVDDHEVRAQQALRYVAEQTGKPIQPDQEKVLRSLALNHGPIRIEEVASDPHPSGRFFRLVGDYTDANQRSGIVHIHMLFAHASKSIYGFHHADAIFREGPSYEQVYGDETHVSEFSTVGGMG